MIHATDRRRFLATGLGLAAAPLFAASPAGPAVLDGQWTDSARGRDIPWRLRTPAGPGPWPLLLFSHGLGGSRDGGVVWGEAWAAAGLAVLHLQHPGSDTATARSGLRQLRAAASPEQLAARVADMRFALDEVGRQVKAGSGPCSAARLEALGVAGHSFGAHTTAALAGQRYAQAATWADPRPKAFIAFSPSSPANGRRSVQEAFGGITRPFMAITGSADGDPLGDSRSGEPRAAVYDGLPAGQKALLWLDGADHMTFGGGRPEGAGGRLLRRRGGSARELDAQHHAVVARVTTAWWRLWLLGDAAARETLAQPQGLGPQDRLQMG